MKSEDNKINPAKTFYRYKILTIKDRITDQGLLAEISRRKLSKDLVSTYLKQGQLEDNFIGKNIGLSFLRMIRGAIKSAFLLKISA